METALSIALLVGIFLFVLGLLVVIWAGFKHHFLTGIIAIFPFLNVIILPSVWHRSSIGFYLGIIGALLTLGAWYGGGNQYLPVEAAKYGINLPSHTTVTTDNNTEEASNSESSVESIGNSATENTEAQTNVETAKSVEPDYVPTGDVQGLPPKALYQLTFKNIDTTDLSDLEGEYVRVKQNNGKTVEGKVSKSDTSSLFIDSHNYSGNIAIEVKAGNIRTLEKLVKE